MIKVMSSSELDLTVLGRPAMQSADAGVKKAVEEILAEVRERGDEALREYSLKFDGVAPERFRVTSEEIGEAVYETDTFFRETLNSAYVNIRAFHEKQLDMGYEIAEKPGIVMGRRVLPIERVGIYVPGGTASYPSTVLMNAIPARVAGVPRLIMCTPPEVSKEILVAAHIAGVDEIYRVGGAQAIAAMACGTESIPRVDKITGPGNIYVAEAKRAVFGAVDIDMIAGPSDVLIIADETANAAFVASDMLAQAEHDKRSRAVLVTVSESLAKAVSAEIERQLVLLSRAEIARAAIEGESMIVVAENLDEALNISNAIAPEHLELCVAEPEALLGRIKNAGSVFLGEYTPEALGDYMAGPNHTLPTMGTARFSSALSVDDFVKKTSYLGFTRGALHDIAPRVMDFALREGLTAHSESVRMRVRYE